MLTERPWPPPPGWDDPVPDWPPVVHHDHYRHLPHQLDDAQRAQADVSRETQEAGGADVASGDTP